MTGYYGTVPLTIDAPSVPPSDPIELKAAVSIVAPNPNQTSTTRPRGLKFKWRAAPTSRFQGNPG